VLVSIVNKSGSREVIRNGAAGGVEYDAVDAESGTFRVEVEAPEKRGDYTLVVALGNDHYLATAKVHVRE
jgi:hypothetical protein